MKTFLRTVMTAAALAFAPMLSVAHAQPGFEDDYYVGGSTSSIVVDAAFPNASNSAIYTISITNWDDIAITVEFVSGCGAKTAWDDSTDVNHFLWFENFYDRGTLQVDNLPAGVYTVTVNGDGINEHQVAITVY